MDRLKSSIDIFRGRKTNNQQNMKENPQFVMTNVTIFDM